MAVLAWTVCPLLVLHVLMARRSRRALCFQLMLDIVLAVVVGPAVLTGADLNPVRCLSRNRPFTDWQWSGRTELQPTQSDVVLQFHPWWEETRRQILEGRLPLTSERIGAGLPLLANGQTGLMAPVMAPVWALGAERGTTVMAFWKLELAGLGAFLFLWRGWRLRWQAAALGGVAAGCSAYQVAWLLVPLSWVTAALPWTWWAMCRATGGRIRLWRIVGAGAFAGWLLGCGLHPETAVVVVGSACLTAIVMRPARWPRVVAVVGVAAPIAVALALPTLGYISASSKVELAGAESPHSEPYPLAVRAMAARQMLLPAVNGHPGRGDWRAPYPAAAGAAGVGSIALATLFMGGVRRRHRRLAWAAVASLAVVAILVYRVPPLDWVLVRVPPFDRMTLPRFLALAPFALGILAALSAEGLVNGLRRAVAWRWLPAIVLALVAVSAAPWRLAAADQVLVGVGVALAAVALALASRPGALAVVAAIELALYAVGVNPVAVAKDRLPRPSIVGRLQALQAETGGRILGIGGMLPGNLASRFQLADLRAYDPLRPTSFVALMQALGQEDPVLGGPLRIAPPRLTGAWSVRYLMTPPGIDAEGWERAWSDASGSIWSNPHWLPELRVVGRTIPAPAGAGWDLLTGETLDLGAVAVVPEGVPRADATQVGFEEIRATGRLIEARVRCDGPCLVVLARPWAPGWRAEVAGDEVAVVRANLAGLGLRVPAGEHDIRLTYNPWRVW